MCLKEAEHSDTMHRRLWHPHQSNQQVTAKFNLPGRTKDGLGSGHGMMPSTSLKIAVWLLTLSNMQDAIPSLELHPSCSSETSTVGTSDLIIRVQNGPKHPLGSAFLASILPITPNKNNISSDSWNCTKPLQCDGFFSWNLSKTPSTLLKIRLTKTKTHKI